LTGIRDDESILSNSTTTVKTEERALALAAATEKGDYLKRMEKYQVAISAAKETASAQ
jgi:hypothetical protein